MGEKISNKERAVKSLGVLGAIAEGSVQPRGDQVEDLPDTIDRVVSGEFHRAVDHDVVCGCIDGRSGGALRASSAGGTISLMAARDLTGEYSGGFQTTEALLTDTINRLSSREHPIGGHDDDHASEEKSGCGANDQIENIYHIIANKGDELRKIARQIGFEVDDGVHERIMQKANDRASFSNPTTLTKALRDYDDEAIDTLRGPHNEVMITINRRKGTTLDHNLMAERLGGEDLEAFNVDIWAFESSAQAVASNPKDEVEVQNLEYALVLYNLATAVALCGPKIEIVEVS